MQNQWEFGNDILDMRDILSHRRELMDENPEDVEHWDEDDQEYMALVAELEDQLWTSMHQVAHNHEPALIRDTYFTTYAQEFAEEIGRVGRDQDWPVYHIDWEAAANDLKQDYVEYSIGEYTYYGRA